MINLKRDEFISTVNYFHKSLFYASNKDKSLKASRDKKDFYYDSEINDMIALGIVKDKEDFKSKTDMEIQTFLTIGGNYIIRYNYIDLPSYESKSVQSKIDYGLFSDDHTTINLYINLNRLTIDTTDVLEALYDVYYHLVVGLNGKTKDAYVLPIVLAAVDYSYLTGDKDKLKTIEDFIIEKRHPSENSLNRIMDTINEIISINGNVYEEATPSFNYIEIMKIQDLMIDLL